MKTGGIGIGIGTLLFLIFLTLKLGGWGVVATWSWWWVTAPLWGGLALVFGIALIITIIENFSNNI